MQERFYVRASLYPGRYAPYAGDALRGGFSLLRKAAALADGVALCVVSRREQKKIHFEVRRRQKSVKTVAARRGAQKGQIRIR